MKYIVKKILNISLYFCIFYIIASILKYIYLYLVSIFKVNRLIVFNVFYIDEIFISILVVMFIFRHIKVQQTLIK